MKIITTSAFKNGSVNVPLFLLIKNFAQVSRLSSQTVDSLS